MKHRDNLLWTFPRATIVVLLLLFCTINTAPAQTTLPAEDIAEKAKVATVFLEMKDKNGKTLGIGSGFFVKPNLIATKYHVIEGAARGTAKLIGKSTTYNIEGVTATDKTNDLAILKVTAYYGIEPLPLGDSDTVQIGEIVYVESQLLGLVDLFSDGIIKSRHYKYTTEFLLMTAPTSPGSDGSAVLNRNGKVIAISISSLHDPDVFNLNFAIPSNYLKKLLNQSNRTKPLFQGNHIISAETYFKRGNTYYDLGSANLEAYKLETYKLAIFYYSEAIRQKQNYHEAYFYRGLAKTQLGQPSEALTDFDAAIRLKPDHARAYFGRALAKGLLGHTLELKQDLQTALELAKKTGDTNFETEIESMLQKIR